MERVLTWRRREGLAMRVRRNLEVVSVLEKWSADMMEKEE